MFYYRFRTASELAIKELMYDEIYFASTQECNDPFDGKTFLVFEADKDKWKRLLELAWKNYNNPNRQIWEEQLSEYLARIESLTYDAALKLDYVQVLQSLESPPDPITAFMLGNQITNFLDLYRPKDICFASFSRANNELLMWAHYASMHQGYCLIFKAIDNKLYQCTKRKRKSIQRNTPKGIAPQMSYGIPESFDFQDVSYSLDSISNDPAYYLPQPVFGQELDEHERNDIITKKNQQYLVKHDCWSYEQESRLILYPPDAYLFGEHVEYSQNERLFHYQPNQLVGIILGARMEDKQKIRIREIVKERMERIGHEPSKNSPVFNFVLFQATLPDSQREVVVNPEEIFTLSGTIGKNDSKFEKSLQEWKDGYAIVFNESGASIGKF
jgi:hypothetical protein